MFNGSDSQPSHGNWIGGSRSQVGFHYQNKQALLYLLKHSLKDEEKNNFISIQLEIPIKSLDNNIDVNGEIDFILWFKDTENEGKFGHFFEVKTTEEDISELRATIEKLFRIWKCQNNKSQLALIVTSKTPGKIVEICGLIRQFQDAKSSGRNLYKKVLNNLKLKNNKKQDYYQDFFRKLRIIQGTCNPDSEIKTLLREPFEKSYIDWPNHGFTEHNVYAILMYDIIRASTMQDVNKRKIDRIEVLNIIAEAYVKNKSIFIGDKNVCGENIEENKQKLIKKWLTKKKPPEADIGYWMKDDGMQL